MYFSSRTLVLFAFVSEKIFQYLCALAFHYAAFRCWSVVAGRRLVKPDAADDGSAFGISCAEIKFSNPHKGNCRGTHGAGL